MSTAGVEKQPLVIMPAGMVMGLSVAMLSSCGVGAEKVEVWVDLGLKTGKQMK